MRRPVTLSQSRRSGNERARTEACPIASNQALTARRSTRQSSRRDGVWVAHTQEPASACSVERGGPVRVDVEICFFPPGQGKVANTKSKGCISAHRRDLRHGRCMFSLPPFVILFLFSPPRFPERLVPSRSRSGTPVERFQRIFPARFRHASSRATTKTASAMPALSPLVCSSWSLFRPLQCLHVLLVPVLAGSGPFPEFTEAKQGFSILLTLAFP